MKTIVKKNLFDYVSSRVLSQLGNNELLYPIVFFSKILNLAECNYEIYNKEWLAIIRCFKQWKLELENTGVPIKDITDYKSLEYFISIKKLIRRQACWAKFLSNFNFVIFYTLDKENQKADLLIRNPNNFPINNNHDC